jgi:UDP-glucose 4-epimerase
VKVVITGATGFIGQALVRRTCEAGWETVLTARPGHSGLPAKAKSLLMSMEEYSTLGRATGGSDCFVHLAWAGLRSQQRMDEDLQEKNLTYSVQAIESMLQAGCRRIVLAGSQAEYGPIQERVTEAAECRPSTAYGRAKLRLLQEASRLCSQYGAACKELRVFSLFGPGDRADTLISSTLRRMLKNEPCPFTLGTQRWDYLYISDGADAFFRSCTADCPDGSYNIASGVSLPLREYITRMAAVARAKSPLLFGALPTPAAQPSLWPDITKARRELGWEPRVAFEAGIQSILEAWSQQEPAEAQP